jgi:DNA-directed RNA polymerase subunit RPC12/RpoP
VHEFGEPQNFVVFGIEKLEKDIAFYMENKKKLRQLHIILVLTGLPMGIWQWGSILLWIFKGIWWPCALYVPIGIVYAICISKFYFNRVAYICPECHEVFRPRFKEAFWARHTPTLRKLTCTHCGYHGFCVETYGGKEEK